MSLRVALEELFVNIYFKKDDRVDLYNEKGVQSYYMVISAVTPVAWALLKAVLLALIVLFFSLEGLLILVGALIAIAFYVVFERKLIGAIQRRRGPNVVGFWGVAQSLADGLKLLSKEVLVPAKANRFLFILAPILAIVLSLAIFAVLPISPYS